MAMKNLCMSYGDVLSSSSSSSSNSNNEYVHQDDALGWSNL